MEHPKALAKGLNGCVVMQSALLDKVTYFLLAFVTFVVILNDIIYISAEN